MIFVCNGKVNGELASKLSCCELSFSAVFLQILLYLGSNKPIQQLILKVKKSVQFLRFFSFSESFCCLWSRDSELPLMKSSTYRHPSRKRKHNRKPKLATRRDGMEGVPGVLKIPKTNQNTALGAVRNAADMWPQWPPHTAHRPRALMMMRRSP